MTKSQARREIATLFAIFLPLTLVPYWLLLGLGTNPRPTITLIMWSIGTAALITAWLRKIPLASFGWGWGPWRYHAWAVGLPLTYSLTAYCLADALGVAQLGATAQVTQFVSESGFAVLGLGMGLVMSVLLTFMAGLPGSFSTALGEEIGWRGFLTPRVNIAFGFLLGTFLTGVVWASWHMPALFLGPYNGGGSPVWEAACFAINVIAACGFYAWLRIASGSLWPAATAHAAHNLIVQGIFDPLSARGASEITMVGEFGVVFTIVAVIFTLPFWWLGQRLWQAGKAGE